VARSNGATETAEVELPELRIVPEELWDRVQGRLAIQRAEVEQTMGAPRRKFWEQKRPGHLLTRRVVCGCCGRVFVSVGRDYLACRVAAAGGPCTNKARVRRGPLEAEVLEALGSRLMQPELVAEFVREFTAEWNRLIAAAGVEATAKHRELEQVRRKLAGLVEAITDGLRAPGLQARLEELEARRVELEAAIAMAEQAAPAPLRLHANLAEVYRERVPSCATALPRGGAQRRWRPSAR
jgi:hypothetical protein